MKHTFLQSPVRGAKVLALAASIVLSSCVDDYWNSGGDGGNGPVTLAFSPTLGNHAETRADTYNGTWAEFQNFFGGTNQIEDIFEHTDADMVGYGREADRLISTFRVLVYNSA
jgi:hypothetical protein